MEKFCLAISAFSKLAVFSQQRWQIAWFHWILMLHPLIIPNRTKKEYPVLTKILMVMHPSWHISEQRDTAAILNCGKAVSIVRMAHRIFFVKPLQQQNR